MKVGAVKAILYLRASVKFFPCLVHLSSHLEKKSGTWYVHKNLLRASFVKIAVKAILLHRGINEFLSVLSTYCAVWVKFSIRDLHTVLLTTCFMKIGTGNAILRLPCSQNCMYACTMKPFDILKVTNAVVKSVYYVMEYTIFNLVIPVKQRHA